MAKGFSDGGFKGPFTMFEAVSYKKGSDSAFADVLVIDADGRIAKQYEVKTGALPTDSKNDYTTKKGALPGLFKDYTKQTVTHAGTQLELNASYIIENGKGEGIAELTFGPGQTKRGFSYGKRNGENIGFQQNLTPNGHGIDGRSEFQNHPNGPSQQTQDKGNSNFLPGSNDQTSGCNGFDPNDARDYRNRWNATDKDDRPRNHYVVDAKTMDFLVLRSETINTIVASGKKYSPDMLPANLGKFQSQEELAALQKAAEKPGYNRVVAAFQRNEKENGQNIVVDAKAGNAVQQLIAKRQTANEGSALASNSPAQQPEQIVKKEDITEGLFQPINFPNTEEQLAKIQRSDYEQTISQLNRSLFTEAEAVANTKLEMQAYDKANAVDQMDLVASAYNTRQSVAYEASITQRQQQISDFLADPEKVDALKAAITKGGKVKSPIVEEFQLAHGGLEADGKAGKSTKAEFSKLENGVTREAVVQVLAMNKGRGTDSLGLPLPSGNPMEAYNTLLPPLDYKDSTEAVLAATTETPTAIPAAIAKVGPVPAPEEPQEATRAQILAAAENTKYVVKKYVAAKGADFEAALSNLFTTPEAENTPALAAKTTPSLPASTILPPVVAVAQKPELPAPAPIASQGPLAAEPSALTVTNLSNPFNVEQALAKADIKPATPENTEPKANFEQTEQEFIKAKVTEVFARYNGEQGRLVPVYQRHDKLSPTDRAAATLVQQSYNLIGLADISEKELGHVEGGETKKLTRDYQDLHKLKRDGIVGGQTYAMLEQDVMKAIEKNPTKGKEFLAQTEKIVHQQLADIAAENKNFLVDNNTAAKDPSKDLAATQRSTGRDGVPS